MKQIIAAIASTLGPLVLLGAVGGFEMGVMPWWGLLLTTTAALYAEWWGLSTLETIGE